jgi:hypothetical protein
MSCCNTFATGTGADCRGGIKLWHRQAHRGHTDSIGRTLARPAVDVDHATIIGRFVGFPVAHSCLRLRAVYLSGVRVGVGTAWWHVAVVTNLVIAVAYFAICGHIVSGLRVTRQWRDNPLGVATAAIFFTCGVHHGSHTARMLLPFVGAEQHAGLEMRAAFNDWHAGSWDLVHRGRRAVVLVATRPVPGPGARAAAPAADTAKVRHLVHAVPANTRSADVVARRELVR